jgi:XTP/dITP diphosphohydrolase
MVGIENTIYFVTSNKGKFAEAQAILGGLIQKDLGYTEIQADTLEEVASYGIREVMEKLQAPVMIEDAGLFIEGLEGFPGVYSAYVQKTIGNEGILRLMAKASNRQAFFRSVVCYTEPGEGPFMFKGEVHGQIGFQPRGSQGFGYDPIFYVDGRSLGEMELEEKNRISHRSASSRALKAWLDGGKRPI